MRRILFSALALCLVPALATAEPKKTDIKKAAGEVRVIPTVAPGEAKPASFSTTPVPAPVSIVEAGPAYYGPAPGPLTFSARFQAAYNRHIFAPDGCPTPIGCSNHWTEKKFIFGSCRQFFGTAQSAVGHHRNTTILD
jgi:hypothetical protein